MSDFFEKLKEYFNQNTEEQIKKDWEKSKHFDEIKPTIEEFLDIQLKYTSTDKLGNKKIG
jgi:hypothetical protein